MGCWALKTMIEIQPFSKQYSSGVADVIVPIQQEEFDIPITLEAQSDLLDIPQFYQKDNGNFWVALDSSEVIGTIALIDIGNNEGALRKMFVKKKYRGSGSGVAQNLLQTLFDWCKKHDYSSIYLGTTTKFHAAHRFYEKNAFIEVEKTELPDSFPVMSVDTKFYKYWFEQK